MMKKKLTLLISIILIFGLLAACGNNAGGNDQAAGHEGHGGQNATDNKGSDNSGHSGHGDDSQTASGNPKASFTFVSGGAKAKEDTELAIQITGDDGMPINDFEVNHEKLLHLIIVNHDLSFFNHIHPEFQGDGKFTVDTSFPAGGEYKVFADFIPSGGTNATLSEWVEVEGEEGEHADIIPDSNLIKEVDGKEIELALSGMKPEEEITLSFTIRDSETKEGISNLESYLGAVGHVVILSADAESYLHVHPLDEKTTGPVAEFATTFPQSGTYKIWGQFQHNGKVITVPFVVEVK
ncbi:hypothetical protein L1N85_24215 [Paenibacillus alkaliterrae]|uniref:hypothetical protein n=1 Tax=Paenibacillus alkaliterrae TaxID=320909 RepID=UPI001F333A7A|nr:hypothetical protein [Paenibacillus alkaliterrae]MCF2941454.1 hypothetical protein [Paenibacillus alkaliterrae]